MHLRRALLILSSSLLAGCGTPETPDFDHLRLIAEGIDEAGGAGPLLGESGGEGIWWETDSPLNPSGGRFVWGGELGRSSLAACDSSEPLCSGDGACFGWVVFEFELLPDGSSKLPFAVASCPEYLRIDPILREVSSWEFKPPPKFKGSRVFSSTIVAYPLGYEL